MYHFMHNVNMNLVNIKVNVNANVNVNFKVKINMVIMIKEIKVTVEVKVKINMIIKDANDNEINDIIININNINEIKEENKNIHLVEGYMMRIKWRINKLKITLNFLICMVVMVEEIKETKDK
eukprot:419121_1